MKFLTLNVVFTNLDFGPLRSRISLYGASHLCALFKMLAFGRCLAYVNE